MKINFYFINKIVKPHVNIMYHLREHGKAHQKSGTGKLISFPNTSEENHLINEGDLQFVCEINGYLTFCSVKLLCFICFKSLKLSKETRSMLSTGSRTVFDCKTRTGFDWLAEILHLRGRSLFRYIRPSRVLTNMYPS
jgi:hypothetical protein